MATTPTKPKVQSLYDLFTNPGGGLSLTGPISFGNMTSTPATLNKAPLTLAPTKATPKITLPTPATGLNALMGGGATTIAPPVSMAYANSTPQTLTKSPLTLSQIASGAPSRPVVASTPAPAPVSAPAPMIPRTGPAFAGGSPAPATPAAPTPEAAPVPKNWLKPDGTFKTPEEIAAEIGTVLQKSSGQGDIGKLALGQFGANNKTVEQLRTEARRIGNTRNDIAVGETDPYKVASDSGIAYTAQELAAIEKAYAGVYDPALDSALSKVEAKQKSDAEAAAAKADLDKVRLQAELDANKPYTLGKNEVRYDAKGNPIAVGVGDTPTGTGLYTPGENLTVDAYIKGLRSGTYKASDVPDEYKSLVAQGMAKTQPAVSKSSQEASSVIDSILASDILEQVSGIPNVSTFIPGTDAQKILNFNKRLKGILSLENRNQLKGQGAISDFEFRVLGEAASALGIGDSGRTNLKKEDFVAELEKLQLKLQVGETTLADDELLYLKDQGYTPEEIRAYSQQQSFGSVGNTKASTGTGNIPQRNNNPGNVKSGGLADSLAVGEDGQGHLIFRSPEDGFKALRLDLTAKINGQSKYLPANPTIAQLGKAYAEDPTWPKKVAMMVGVGVNTPTASVPFDKLVKAIATQEGFYA